MGTTVGEVYRGHKSYGPFDALVIGSGLGGLTAASILAQQGQSVAVLEKHYVAGGFTHVFHRKEYEWDVGLHYVGEMHRPNSAVRRVFDAVSDGSLEWEPMQDVYDTICIGQDRYPFHTGVTAWREGLLRHFPDAAPVLDRYIEAVFAVSKAAAGYFGTKALAKWMGTLAQSLMARKFFAYSRRTTDDVLREMTTDQRLIGVLTGQWGDYGLPPKQSSFAMHAMLVKHYWNGGSYPVGGSSRIAQVIAPKIEAAGGRILLKAGVKEILIENGKAVGVRLESGDELRAPLVISDAGAHLTFQRLLPSDFKPADRLREQVKKVAASLSHVCLYVGIKATAQDLQLPGSNQWIYPSDDHDANIKEYLEDPSGPLPLVYISFPSGKDPDWERRHPGTSTVEVLGFAPYEWFLTWEDKPWRRRGDEYESLKDELTSRYLEALYEACPQLKGRIDYFELSTPLSTRHFAQYRRGEIYGLTHTPERFDQKWLRPKTPIENLYLTGQDIVTVGIGGALMGGVLTASAILRRNLIPELIKRA